MSNSNSVLSVTDMVKYTERLVKFVWMLLFFYLNIGKPLYMCGVEELNLLTSSIKFMLENVTK